MQPSWNACTLEHVTNVCHSNHDLVDKMEFGDVRTSKLVDSIDTTTTCVFDRNQWWKTKTIHMSWIPFKDNSVSLLSFYLIQNLMDFSCPPKKYHGFRSHHGEFRHSPSKCVLHLMVRYHLCWGLVEVLATTSVTMGCHGVSKPPVSRVQGCH